MKGLTLFWNGLEGYRAPLATGFLAMLLTGLLTPLAKMLALRFGAVDDPKRDNRRVHKEPMPKWGGMAIFAGVVLALLLIIPLAYPITLFPRYLIGMILVGGGIVAFGAWDDLKDLNSRTQMAYLLGAGVVIQLFSDRWGHVQITGINPPFAGSDVWVSFGWLAVPLTAGYIFVVSKTMDTIDGVDGLAGGVAFIAAATLAIIGFYEQQPRVALVAAAVAGASGGFLFHNFNPARIFMGTGGAQVLGFLLASLSIVGALKTVAALAMLVPMLVFAVPLTDMVVVIVRRAASGDPIMQADKRHLHHTLLKSGLTQRQTVFVLYAFASVFCAVLVMMVIARK